MVKRGLNVGQTFEDGGFTYEVKKVNHDGSYESKRVILNAEDSVEEETESAENKSGGRKGKSAQ